MTRVLVAGLRSSQAARIGADTGGDSLTFETASDFDAAVAVASGEAEYYVGICQSGAGAALAMAIGLLGSDRARSVSTPGRPPSPTEIQQAVDEGVVAFGVPLDHIETAVPLIVQAILSERREG